LPSPRRVLLLALAIASFSIIPSNSNAASVSCTDAGIECISDTGYAGQETWGYPVDATGNNCTTYVAYRLMQNGAPNIGGFGDATHWADGAAARGYLVDDSPEVGSIAHWTDEGDFAPVYGHVAYVEKVTPGRVFLSDSNYEGPSRLWSVRRRDAEWPDNFIHVKDLTTGSISIGPERTRASYHGIQRGRQPGLDLQLTCPVFGTPCVTVVGGTITARRRGKAPRRFGLGNRVIELDPGETRLLTVALPAGLDRVRRTARSIRVALRIDTLGVPRPTFVRRRLE